MQSEEERQASIDYENRILLAKLTNVLRSTGQLDNWNYDYELHSKSLNQMKMAEEREKINQENQKILKRLKERSSNFDADKWEDEYLMHNYYLDLKNSTTKNFELDVRGMDQEQALYFYGDDRHKRKVRAQYDKVSSNGDTASLAHSQAAVSEKSIKGDEMPNMVELKISKNVSRKKRRTVPRLPAIGMERKKEIERKKKEAAAKTAHYDDKDEAVKLFKASKGMGKPDVVVAQTLAKRKYSQRQQTKSKFEEQFDLNLEEELSAHLDDDYQHLVSALLATREDYDAEAIHGALKGEGPFTETLVEILSTRNNGALSAIKTAYARKYNKELEEDIKSEVKGQLRHLLISLTQGKRGESPVVDNDAAEKDAEQLKATQEDERWNSDSGKMADLLRTASWSHIVTVLHQYEKMTAKNTLDEMERLLGGDYRDAMSSLVKCLSDCPMFLAEQIHQNLQPSGDETTVMRIIIMRSEIDMALIRKAYKRLYGETLMDAVAKKLPLTSKRALVQMVVVHGAPEKPPSNPSQDKQQEADQKHAPSPSHPQHPKPLKRPPPKKDATIAPDNPLAKGNLKTSSKLAAAKSPRMERKADGNISQKGNQADKIEGSTVSLQKNGPDNL